MTEKIHWHEMESPDHSKIHHGDIRTVNLPVTVNFTWSDKIVVDYDPETNTVLEYKSGWVMNVIPNQVFTYDKNETVFLAQTTKE